MKTKTFLKKIKGCYNCQTVFVCSPTNCWCSELPNILPVKEGENCLCPACLQAVIQSEKES